jgi:SAM-dependent methyltransferase
MITLKSLDVLLLFSFGFFFWITEMPTSALKTSDTTPLLEWPDYHSSLPEYAARFPGALGQWILKIQTDKLLEAITPRLAAPRMGPSLQTSYDVIDVGGGHGQVTPTLLELEKRVATVVSDARATDTLTKMLALLPPPCIANYTPIVTPLDELPFESGSIPLAVSLRMVCHMHDWRRFVAELCRVTSSQVIIDYPSLQSANYFQHLFFRAKLKVEGNTRSFTVFDDREIAAEFHRHGFTKIRLYRQFAIPLAFHRVIKKPKVSAMAENLFTRVGLTDLIGSPVILSAAR